MGEPHYVRTISTTISTENTDTLLYTVPSGKTFIAFSKVVGSGSVVVTFKEAVDGSTKKICGVVNGGSEEHIKERYEAGTVIYVNGATASSGGSSTNFGWGDVDSFVVSGAGSNMIDGTYTYMSNAGNGSPGYVKVQGNTYFYVNNFSQTVFKIVNQDLYYYPDIVSFGGTKTWISMTGGSNITLTLTAGSGGSGSGGGSFSSVTASMTGILYDTGMIPVAIS